MAIEVKTREGVSKVRYSCFVTRKLHRVNNYIIRTWVGRTDLTQGERSSRFQAQTIVEGLMQLHRGTHAMRPL